MTSGLVHCDPSACCDLKFNWSWTGGKMHYRYETDGLVGGVESLLSSPLSFLLRSACVLCSKLDLSTVVQKG